jgi:hypothetical protein
MRKYTLFPLVIATCLSLNMPTQAGIKDNIKHSWTKHKTAFLTTGTIGAVSLGLAAYMWKKLGSPLAYPGDPNFFGKYAQMLLSVFAVTTPAMSAMSFFSRCKCEEPKVKVGKSASPIFPFSINSTEINSTEVVSESGADYEETEDTDSNEAKQ